MNIAIYLRKSRADEELERVGEGETLARHERILLALAKKQGHTVGEIYREIVSGETIASRPEMQRLLGDVEKGEWEGVMCMEVERLARGDTIDQGIVAQAFKISDTLIITPVKTYDPNNQYDEEYFEFGLFMARREYKTINRRLQSGRLAASKEGQYLGSIAPYGYRKTTIPSPTRHTLEPFPEQAEIVKLIFRLYAYGENGEALGMAKIADRLNAIGATPLKAKQWQIESISSILHNPVYAGKIKWFFRKVEKTVVNGAIVRTRPRNNSAVIADGLHEAIIDDETWDAVQKRLSRKKYLPPVPAKSHIENPLAGIIVCGICGRAMVRRPYSSGQEPTLMCSGRKCSNVSSYLSLVENEVIENIRKYYSEHFVVDNKNRPVKNPVQTSRKTEIAAANKNLTTAKGQLSKAYDLLEQGVYATDVFLERSKSIGDRISSIEKRIKDLEMQDEAEAKSAQEIESLAPKMLHVIDTYSTKLSPADRNALLKSITEKIVYTKYQGCRWKENSFEIAFFPRSK